MDAAVRLFLLLRGRDRLSAGIYFARNNQLKVVFFFFLLIPDEIFLKVVCVCVRSGCESVLFICLLESSLPAWL